MANTELRNVIFGNGPVETMKAIYEMERDEYTRLCDEEKARMGFTSEGPSKQAMEAITYMGKRVDIAHKAWIAMEDAVNRRPF